MGLLTYKHMFMNAIIAGLLYFLSFPPFDFWYLIFPALYLFYYSLLSSEKSFLSGFVFGCVAYGVILLGIQSIGLEAWTPLTILMGLILQKSQENQIQKDYLKLTHNLLLHLILLELFVMEVLQI